MMEKQQASASNGFGYYAAKISELLAETITLLNLEDMSFSLIPLEYMITDNPEAFLGEGVSLSGSNSVYFFLYEKGNNDNFVYTAMTLADFDNSIKLCIKNGEFLAWGLKSVLRKLKRDFLAKIRGDSCLIFQDLFKYSNSVIFKGENPVLVVPEATEKPFYLVSRKTAEEGAKPRIFLDFLTNARIASSYPEPKTEIFNNNEPIKIVFYLKDRSNEIVAELGKAEGSCFTISTITASPDYMKTKKAISANYNNSGRILTEIIDNRLSADAAGLLDIIL